MARMCVKTKRLDVAMVCLGKMLVILSLVEILI